MTTQIFDIDGTAFRIKFEGSIELRRMFDGETVAISPVGDNARVILIEALSPEESAERGRKRREASQVAALERRMEQLMAWLGCGC